MFILSRSSTFSQQQDQIVMKRKRNTIPESDDDASFVNNSDYSVLDKSHTQQTLDGPFDVHKSESEHSIGETNESK